MIVRHFGKVDAYDVPLWHRSGVGLWPRGLVRVGLWRRRGVFAWGRHRLGRFGGVEMGGDGDERWGVMIGGGIWRDGLALFWTAMM
jgi:hypothetical protein